MVAGGSNSLVLSAAYHCYVFSRPGDNEERGRGDSRPEGSQMDPEGHDTWVYYGEEPGEQVSLDERVGHDSDRIPQQTALCGASNQTSPARNGESTENLQNPEDDYLIPMAEDLEDWEQSESGGIAMHLGFGDELANIRSPQEGGLYV
ncbi:hypothetical protein F4776DRAFT_664001 [Hypoxylon sp. NC0597]|nr:hypothetical protein F4776DRAFT_664001 [Hypoxylon sp. NC0597]